MRKIFVIAIRVIAALMLVAGFIVFITHYDWAAGLGYFFGTCICSVFAYGFSYVVEACCRYLEKCEEEPEAVE